MTSGRKSGARRRLPNVSHLISLTALALSLTLTPSHAEFIEKTILSHLYNSLNGDNWDVSWDTSSDDYCSYPGVQCEGENVIEISLPENNLIGTITPHLYMLPNLKKVDFSKNEITNGGWDRIEQVLKENTLHEKVNSIEVIDLTSNKVASVEGIGKIGESLKELHLTYNNLKGPMPDDFFELRNLRLLAMSENGITGKIDTRIGTLAYLQELYCYGNEITGEIPTEIGALTKMQILTFAENKLSGPIPDEVKHMGNLKTFSVHNNDPNTGKHSGPLPKFDTQPFLKEIYLEGNEFTGEIPHLFLHMYNETDEPVTIGLSNNLLTGTIPVQFLKFQSLELDVVGNSITGFNEKICESDSINAWMNGLVEQYGCDAILCPEDTYAPAGRQEEEDEPCQPCGAGTDGFLGATFCGSVEKDIVELEILAELYLSLGGNQWDDVTGWEGMLEIEVPEDVSLAAYDDLNPCNFFGITCSSGKVVEVDLSNNGLEGMVPSSLFDLPELLVLDLSGNEVHLDREYGFGDIGNAKKLAKVDLSSNDIQKFKGLGASTSITELYVDDAYFFGKLDTELYEMEQLTIIHFQYSGLTGEIPEGLSKLSNLRTINLYGNEFNGPFPKEIGSMPSLYHIDFSENDFEGDLPTDAIANLVDLQQFHVSQSSRSGKGITGKLPSFKEQTNLKSLDLSSNSMTGAIPDDFLSGIVDTSQAIEVKLSYNSFTGKIPGFLSKFQNMVIIAEKCKFTEVDSDLCDLDSWMNGDVGLVKDDGENGCDGILCPKGTYNDFGRAVSGDGDIVECMSCPGGEFAGATTCGDNSVENQEKHILDLIFKNTGGTGWDKSANWTSTTICNYEGVKCASNDPNMNEGVEEIRLSGFGLIGEVPSDLYKLPFLKLIDLSNNDVSLPFEGIELAVNLETIIMSDADLETVAGIENAPASLTKLHIERNSFDYVDIPKELFSVTSLESLSIGFNGFGGSLTSDIGKLKNLKEFWAGGNDITGFIPHEISQLIQLENLALPGNRMSGSIPNSLEDIPTLRILHLNGQRDFGGFTGPVPSFDTAPKLHDVNFSRNSLSGPIPDNFLAAVRASTDHDIYSGDMIDMSFNQITGTIPADFDDFASLFINLAGNMITGVPTDLCDDDDEFMDGMVGLLQSNKCDAILCPKGTFSAVGRQVDVDVPCEPCPGETQEEREMAAPYFGSLFCVSLSIERGLLEQLYTKIFTTSSEDKHWGSSEPICSWYGITCGGSDLDEEGVIEIDLESNHLVLQDGDQDEVSKIFFNLPSLEVLNLRGNQVPLKFDHVGYPTNLRLLQISATGLSSIEGISAATNLKELHVTENNLEGKFPEEIFELTKMEKLYLSFNKFSGSIPTRIGELTNLVDMYAFTNEMTGTIPTEFGKLENLETLVLGQNKFRGSLPAELNNLANLIELSFYYQESEESMTGQILDFSRASRLGSLDLEGNKFTGSIPYNFLSGLDTDFRSSEEAIVVHLADNMLTGTLPEALLTIRNLYIDIVGNRIEGPIPEEFCEQSLWMDGAVGDIGSCDAIACPVNTFSVTGRFDVSGDDDGSECTPCGAFETAPFLGSKTCIKGKIERMALEALYDATGGDSWEQNTNWRSESKPICSWYGVICSGSEDDDSGVISLDLNANQLEGTMPKAIFELPYLQTLDLKENKVYISFENIREAEKLEVLYLSVIDIGNIEGIGKAPSLRTLHLTGNNLSGQLPEEIFDLSGTLEQLYIAYNSFSGTLSTRFGEMKKLTDLYAYDNDFSGTIPAEFASLEKLETLVLAENTLSGSIPKEFNSMPSLKLFSVYRRLKAGPKLTGHLPSFSNVPQLQGLYLDYNHLSGAIPKDFLKSSLNTQLITLSHNLLTGPVPIELDRLDTLNIEMEGNKISDLDQRFCDNDSWMNKAVSKYSCDGILCPPHTYSMFGRQNTTESLCQNCDPNQESTPFWGSTSCDVPVDEREILELLYNRCGGPSWHNSDNWLSSKDICKWYGIDCKNGTSVQSIRLGANNLIGTPPEEIFLLRQLHILWLHSNPIEFKFKGIEKATNLVELRLDSTGLSDLYGAGSATTLLRLGLKYNQISGPFPDELLRLYKLETLELTDNRMTGELPKSFEDMGDLLTLRLGSNEFSGALPTFEGLPYLLHLDLSDNKLEGTIPEDFLEEISTRKPVEIDLSSNRLSGTVPEELDRFSSLVIYLRDNQFTSLPQILCDKDNRSWNLGDVKLYGCDAIMCPPGTASFLGRQSSETTPCEKCESNTNLYGQVTCDGTALSVPSSAPIYTTQNIWRSSILSLSFGLFFMVL